MVEEDTTKYIHSAFNLRMESIIQWLLLVSTIAVTLAYDRPPAAEPSDITSINSLNDKNNIKSFLLRVIKTISDNTQTLPEDFPQDDYLRLLSAHHAEAEDLGSLELTPEQEKAGEYIDNGQFGKKLTESKKDLARETSSPTGNTDFGKYYISPTNTERRSGSENLFEESPNEMITEPLSKNDATTQDPNAQSKDNVEESQPKETTEYAETTTIQPETQTYPAQAMQEFNGYKEEPIQSIKDSQKSDDGAIIQYMIGRNEDYIAREDNKNYSDNYYQVETPQRQSRNSNENQSEVNAVSDDNFSHDEKTNKFPVEYEFIPSAMESNLVPTKPTPDNEIIVMGPTPIDIPDAQYQEDEHTTPTQISPIRNNSESARETGEIKNKYQNVKHTVEFAASPLVAAFTVQQDDNGIPRKIIPLDYVNSKAVPRPTENPEIVAQRQRELEEKEFILYQQLKSLQEEKYKYITPQQQQEQLLRLQRQEELKKQQQLQHQKELQRQQELKRQQLFTNQNYYNQKYQQSPEYIQQQQLRHQEYLRQQEYFRYQELQRQKEQQYRNNLQQPQRIEFHKSVDFSLPQYEHNRVNRGEPNNFVGNQGFNQPYSVSGQIQHLISSSGISFGLPRNTQADLGVVSKILALNHGGLGPNQNSVSF